MVSLGLQHGKHALCKKRTFGLLYDRVDIGDFIARCMGFVDICRRACMDVSDMTVYEGAMVILMLISTLFAVVTRTRFASIISLGALGFSVALIFVHFSAPDLGITQVLVETLTVLLLVLVLIHVPGFGAFFKSMGCAA